MNGKGDKPRPVDRQKWDNAPYWATLERRKNMDEYLTTKEVMALLRVSRITIWRWVKDGILKQTKVGGKLLYPKSELNKMLETD